MKLSNHTKTAAIRTLYSELMCNSKSRPLEDFEYQAMMECESWLTENVDDFLPPKRFKVEGEL